MQIFKGKNLDDLLALDIFRLLQMESLDQAAKDQYLQKIEELTLRYFLQEKVGDRLTEEQMNEFAEMPLTNEQEMQTFMAKITEYLPNAADIFIDAGTEVKARLIKEQYETMRDDLEALLEDDSDDTKKSLLENKLAQCRLNLNFIENGEWALINAEAVNPDNLSETGE